MKEWDHDNASTSDTLFYNDKNKIASRRLVALALHLDRSNQATYDRMLHLRQSATERRLLAEVQTNANAGPGKQISNVITNTK